MRVFSLETDTVATLEWGSISYPVYISWTEARVTESYTHGESFSYIAEAYAPNSVTTQAVGEFDIPPGTLMPEGEFTLISNCYLYNACRMETRDRFRAGHVTPISAKRAPDRWRREPGEQQKKDPGSSDLLTPEKKDKKKRSKRERNDRLKQCDIVIENLTEEDDPEDYDE